jgi:hypothetical protein
VGASRAGTRAAAGSCRAGAADARDSCPRRRRPRTVSIAVFASPSPAAAAEFPNDNPLLHNGARWVCRETLGAARAILRASGSTVLAAPAEPQVSAARAAPQRVALATPPLPARRYEGPLELDLDRIVIAHRALNVPPPPDFIFRPFVRGARPILGAPVAEPPIQPRPCYAVDGRAAHARVQRNERVDIAPCLSIVATTPVALPTVVERPRRSRRRRPVAARALTVAAFPNPGELERVILELEAAFAKPGLHSRSHEGARVSPCRAGAA